MADPDAEKRKRESEKKAKDKEALATKHSNERLKASQDAKKTKITLVARQKRERESMKETKKIKEDWIEDKIIYKLLDKDEVRAAKKFNAMNKSQKMKFLDAVETISSRNHGYTDDEVVSALQDYDIDISKKARNTWEEIENQQEAENMHKYINTLSLNRSVNVWSEALKKEEESVNWGNPKPVKGSKTLTKKPQEKIEINPTEKQLGARYK